MFACCGGCYWPISPREKLRWPIPVPLTVISDRRNRGGKWWEFAIVGGGSHVGVVFWGYLRVIYRSTCVGIVSRSLIFETSIYWTSTSKIRKSKISTSARHLIFHHQDSVRDPQTPVPLESWDSQLSQCDINFVVFRCHVHPYNGMHHW